MLSSLSLTFSLFFSFPLLSPLSCTIPGATPTSRVVRANFPRVSLVGLLYLRRPTSLSPTRPLARCLRASSPAVFFLLFRFHNPRPTFWTWRRRSDNIGSRNDRLLSRPASTLKREVCIFTRHSVPSGVPSEPTVPPPPHLVLLLFPSCPALRATNSVAAFCSVHRRGIPARQFIRKVFFAFFVVSARHSRRTYMRERLHMCTKI